MKQEVPCYKCDNRSSGCHGSCEEYKVYKQKLKTVSDIRREAHVKSDLLNSFKYDNLNKNLKRRRARK